MMKHYVALVDAKVAREYWSVKPIPRTDRRSSRLLNTRGNDKIVGFLWRWSASIKTISSSSRLANSLTKVASCGTCGRTHRGQIWNRLRNFETGRTRFVDQTLQANIDDVRGNSAKKYESGIFNGSPD
jgi:hypothetical protein